MLSIYKIFFRLLIALILGGIIGIEREGIRRPAGLRTHILVCIGASLVMLSGIYLSDMFINRASIDPSRLGAQVISGIGFLGAGTILKVNSGVKGLTTAASLWSVAGIGIACGIGFYWGAIICTLLILFSLMVFGKIERYIKKRDHELSFKIICENKPDILENIINLLNKKNIIIKTMDTHILKSENCFDLSFIAALPKNYKPQEMLNEITGIDGINNIRIE